MSNDTANGGNGFDPLRTFTGTFNGSGHTISNLTSNRSGEFNVSLFGATGGDATIENVGLVDADITGYGTVGGLVGSNGGTVTDSYATGSVSGGYRVGGLVAYNDGIVTDSYATATVTGTEEVGGLIGNNGGTVSETYATGNATATLSGGNDYVGGLVGYNTASVNDSYATGAVSGSFYAGGLVGYSPSGSVTDGYWNNETSGQSSSYGGTGLTTSEMTGLAAVGNMSGLAFTDSWHVTDSYPALTWQNDDPFYVVEITDTNSPISENTALNVTTNVTNWGANDSTQTIELRDTGFGDDLQDTEDVGLDSGDSVEFTLQWDTAVGTTRQRYRDRHK
ncbi:MAG: GLUG motif-containing protein [Natrialbaceae archaeon]|nr:GLUG motif-containing protein [Natrialbaceae archaeon]